MTEEPHTEIKQPTSEEAHLMAAGEINIGENYCQVNGKQSGENHLATGNKYL